MPEPSAELIENSYRQADGVTGGYGSELWLVKNLQATNGTRYALSVTGLPRVGDPHSIIPTLAVRERAIENIIDQNTVLVRVDYRPVSFDLGTLLSTTTENAKPLRLQLLWERANTPGSTGYILRGGEQKKETQFDFVITPTTRKFTVRAGGDINDVMSRIIRNKDCYYTSAEIPVGQLDPPYLFIDGQVKQLKNGQVIAEYTFWTHYGLRGPASDGSFPVGTWPNQAFSIPKILPGAMIYTSETMALAAGEGTIASPYSIKTMPQMYPKGSELTGL